MFRHKGKSRNFRQNLGIASLLSFVAGVVNVVGFLSVKQLTTNVTGHFAFLVEEALSLNFGRALFFFLYILFFFSGAFFSNLFIELTSKVSGKYVFIIPVFIEIAIIGVIAFLDFTFISQYPNLIACALLFAMGLQNSLVTTISSSAVRTTHLTGLFTDLGIEISQLFFYKSQEQHRKLISSIKLRGVIIGMFSMGAIVAGVVYPQFGIKTLFIATSTLIIGLVIDYLNVRFRLKKIRQRDTIIKMREK